ncbi:MAG TPA: DedA family protein [Candidatus Saccharimonas sp.]|nr:DedA family protein [Candidatus Saccharimonas sp.]
MPGGWQDLVSQYGYLGLAVSLFLNAFGAPIPSEVILPASGVAARSGLMDIWVVATIAMVSQVAGLVAAYLVARHGGLELVERYGKWLRVKPSQLKGLQKLFERHGVGLVLAGICIPGLHGYVAYPAGLARMRFDAFLLVSALGMAVWTAAFVGASVLLSDNLPLLMSLSHDLSVVMVGVTVVIIGLVIWYSKRHARGQRRHRRTG